jgi:hypothetical protein
MKLNVERYPDELAEKVALNKVTGMATVLGLDLGTNCGYSYCFVDDRINKSRIYAGQLDLSAGPYDSGAIRFIRLRHFLSAIKPDLIAYEDVRYTPPSGTGFMSAGALLARAAPACEWFGALKATVSTWAEENSVPCTGMPIGTIKKRATGKGNANKVDIIKACNNEFGFDFDPEGYESSGVDNIADSVYVCALAVEQYGMGFNKRKDSGNESK